MSEIANVRNGQQLLTEIEAATARLAKLNKQLKDEWLLWQSVLNHQVPEKIATSARIGGVDENMIGEYVRSIEHSLKAIRDDYEAAEDDLGGVGPNLGSLAHCIEKLRHEKRKRQEGRTGVL